MSKTSRKPKASNSQADEEVNERSPSMTSGASASTTKSYLRGLGAELSDAITCHLRIEDENLRLATENMELRTENFSLRAQLRSKLGR